MRSSGRLVLAAALVAAAARAEVVERILAVVDARPVMLSDVALVERVRGLPRKQALEATIDERLMFQEAARLPQAVVTPEEETRAYQDLLPRWPAGAGAAPESDLRRLARRETSILKYVDFRFRPQVRVGDEAVREAYAAEYAHAGAPPYESVAAQIRDRLARKDLDLRIEAWVSELRSGAEIRYNPDASS